MESFSSFTASVMLFFMCATVGVSFGAMLNPRLRAIGDTKGALAYLSAVFCIAFLVAVACGLGREAILYVGPPVWLMWWHVLVGSVVIAAIVASILPRPVKNRTADK